MILLDRGPIVALFDPADGDHAACRTLFERLVEPLVTTSEVLTEAFHILSPESVGSQRLRHFLLSGGAAVRALEPSADLHRAFELMETYANLPMDLADASLVVSAERIPTRRIFTLDRRDFTTYRIGRGHSRTTFQLVE